MLDSTIDFISQLSWYDVPPAYLIVAVLYMIGIWIDDAINFIKRDKQKHGHLRYFTTWQSRDPKWTGWTSVLILTFLLGICWLPALYLELRAKYERMKEECQPYQ